MAVRLSPRVSFQNSTGRRPTVLVVDDQPEICELLQGTLELFGYHTLVARDGGEALELTHRFRPDVMTLDLLMPGMAGPALLAELADDPSLRTLPVVVISASVAELVRTPQVVAALSKPFELLDLVEALAEALEGARY
jgi:CheY-like chemotaxis protein